MVEILVSLGVEAEIASKAIQGKGSGYSRIVKENATMLKRLGAENFFAEILLGEHSASISGGNMGSFDVLPSVLFEAQIKRFSGETEKISSLSTWERVSTRECESDTEILFCGYERVPELSVILSVREERQALVWRVRVLNNSAQWSVMNITYPTPVLKKSEFDLFIPRLGGRTVCDAGNKGFGIKTTYPGVITMQYFAVYSENSGVYLGVEDEKAAVKQYEAKAEDGEFSLTALFYATGGGLMGNSFDAYGEMRWQGFAGDWYDAAMIYADFVYKKAEWLPELYRPDTHEKFKNIPFWVCDYIPNIQSQGNNKPMFLSAGSDIHEPEYWYEAPIALQKELGGMPIAYHVYNWCKIPFNIEFPHFLPAKETFLENAPKLREKGICVMPYINAVSWEMRDGEMGHEVNFDNTGVHGSVILENGETLHEDYPQVTVSGHNSCLVQMCPSFEVWHGIIEKLSRDMAQTLPIDGIYYDQTAATPARPCYNPEHNHLPGGGSFWSDGYNRMMQRVSTHKPADFFYFTESCAEPYMKSFDGYLTWNWVYPEDVPAFAAIYAGYIQMVGRVTDGKKKDDLGFFKYCNARSLVYGQQLGWCKADIIWRPEWMHFIKNAVKVRCDLSDLFNHARMLRPPVVSTPLPKFVTEAGLANKDNIESEIVVAGAWRYRDSKETVIIAVNIANESAPFTLRFDAAEYGFLDKELPEGFVLDGTHITVQGVLEKDSIHVWRI